MTVIEQSIGSVVRRRWDDTARTYYEFDAAGNQTLTQPYSAQENADADARATAATRAGNLATLYQQASSAIAANTTFLGIASPTTAQAVSQVQALTRQVNKLIRVTIAEIAADQTALDSTS